MAGTGTGFFVVPGGEKAKGTHKTGKVAGLSRAHIENNRAGALGGSDIKRHNNKNGGGRKGKGNGTM